MKRYLAVFATAFVMMALAYGSLLLAMRFDSPLMGFLLVMTVFMCCTAVYRFAIVPLLFDDGDDDDDGLTMG